MTFLIVLLLCFIPILGTSMATFKFRAWVFDVFSVQHNDDICDFRKFSGFSCITILLTMYRKATCRYFLTFMLSHFDIEKEMKLMLTSYTTFKLKPDICKFSPSSFSANVGIYIQIQAIRLFYCWQRNTFCAVFVVEYKS